MKFLRFFLCTSMAINAIFILAWSTYHTMRYTTERYKRSDSMRRIHTNKYLLNGFIMGRDVQRQDNRNTSLYSSQSGLLLATTERRHIAFLKVHKAASSTAQNIFLRFAKQRDLLVVMPLVPKFLYPHVISLTGTVTERNILPVPKGRFYEILCCHVKYNKAAFARIMPSDTVNIGIVRDPFEHFISTLNYMRPHEVFNINSSEPVSSFLRDPTKYNKRTSVSFINNRMAFEFDFPADLFETRDSYGVEQYLIKLGSEFQLVIIMEMFDESLILMRRLLNWRVKDILYVKLNARKKLYDKITFKPGDVQLYKKWGELDYALYRFFFRRLQVQIQVQGPTFYKELLHFRGIRQDMEIFCSKHSTSNVTYNVPASRWSEAFEISQEDCVNMQKREVQFIREIRSQQYGFYTETF